MTAQPLARYLAALAVATQSSGRGVRRAHVRLVGPGPSDDIRSLDRARSALDAYCARAALDELERERRHGQ
jgi:hypothetical protein